ncbi:MAG: hypothetical protein K2K56_04325 [Lachnospiraceae bacterium]|nr:hypothetical protein [Lachnospiraceae bacterium]
MTDEFKKQIKLIKYGRGFRVSIGVMLLFILMGIFFIISGDYEGVVMGSVEIFFGIVGLLQMEYSMVAIGLCASSPRKRTMETWLPDLSGLVWGIVGYAIILLIVMIKISFFQEANEMKQLYGEKLVFAGMMGAIVIIYSSMAYKSVWGSMIFFFAGFYGTLFASGKDIALNFTVGALSGFFFILLGVVLAGVIRRLLYRKPLNRAAFDMGFRKQV